VTILTDLLTPLKEEGNESARKNEEGEERKGGRIEGRK
jgi:hypothetical protein